MGNKISKSDANIVIGVVNTAFPEKKHLDLNSNTIETVSTPETESIVTTTTVTSTSVTKNSEEYNFEDDGSRVYLRIKDLIDYHNIKLCSRKIIEICPSAIFSTLLLNLDICCNYLREIPESIGLLTNLRTLNVSNNLLTSLPSSIGLLRKLEVFAAAYNKISHLPLELKNLKKLKTLDLKNNNISELYQEYKELKSLVTLDVRSNQLVSVPAEICNIKTLQKIMLNNCPLIYSSCVPSLTKEIPSLKELASRIIIRRNIPISDNLSDELKCYLSSVHQCSFCHGPYFETYEKRNQLIRRNDVNIPLEYRLCISHWTSEEERIKVLFKKLPYTSPCPIDKYAWYGSYNNNLSFTANSVKGLKNTNTVDNNNDLGNANNNNTNNANSNNNNNSNKNKGKLVKSKSNLLISAKSESKSKLSASSNTLSSLISSPSIENYYQVDYKTSEVTFSNELLNLGSSNSSLSNIRRSTSSLSLSNTKMKKDSSFLTSLFSKKN